MYIKFVYIAIPDHCIRTNETKFSYKKKKIRKEKFSYQILPRSQKKKKTLALKPVFILSRYLD